MEVLYTAAVSQKLRGRKKKCDQENAPEDKRIFLSEDKRKRNTLRLKCYVCCRGTIYGECQREDQVRGTSHVFYGTFLNPPIVWVPFTDTFYFIYLSPFSQESPYNTDFFPRSFVKGASEGVWWSFVTMSTVG